MVAAVLAILVPSGLIMNPKKVKFWLATAFAVITFWGAPTYSNAARNSTPKLIYKNFKTALREINAGKPQAAVRRLKLILAQNPTLLRVRLELARALFFAGDMKSARQEFLTALSAKGIPIPVKGNILRFIRAIDAHKGFTHSYLFSLTAPSGAGRSYDTDVVNLDLFHTGRPLPFKLARKNAPRLAGRFEGSVRQVWPVELTPGNGVLAFYLRAHARIVDAPGSAFDADRLDFAPGLQLTWPRTNLTFEARTSVFRTGGAYSESRAGLGATLQMHNANGLSFSADIAMNYANNRINDLYSGRLFEGNFTLQQGTSGNGFYAAALTLESRAASRSDFSYSHAVLRLSQQINFRGGFSVSASVYGDYYLQSSPTPGFAAKRRGREYGIDIKLTETNYLLLNRYTPFFSIGVSRHNSSIKAYSFNDIRFQIGVQSVF